MNRVMPRAGYYLTEGGRVYYCTGTTKGNKWFCPNHHPDAGWMTLMWTCVPGKADIAKYQYSEGPPSGIPAVSKTDV